MRGFLTLAALGCATLVFSQNVYVTTSGNAAIDTAVLALLTSRGMTGTIGVSAPGLNGSQDLTPFDVVYLQPNANWASGTNPTAAGQTALINFVNAGGGLVTAEWLMWGIGGASQEFRDLMPTTYVAFRGGSAFVEGSIVTADPIVTQGLPATFVSPLDNFSGIESNLVTKTGATTFVGSNYGSSTLNTSTLLAGWQVGDGRVMNFSTLNGTSTLADPAMNTLIGNSLKWAAVPEPMTLSVLAMAGLVLARRKKKAVRN
ncbi:MAG: ThuA domain-containing protein [Fimbriimonadaceae bacterium]|jgi:hypothetical protein|nr:ThuA domain-containing protein [Fimbriimonadaceae bacterium]